MPEHAFVEQPVLQHRFGKGFLELSGFLAQPADVATAGLALSIPGQPLFPRFQKLLAPAVLQILVQAFPTTQLRDTVFPRNPASTIRIFSSALNFRRVARLMARTSLSASTLVSWFGFIVTPFTRDDEPKTSPSQSPLICPTCAETKQSG